MNVLNEENINLVVTEKAKNEANYKLVDVLDDLYNSNRLQMQRRRRSQKKVEDIIKAKDAEIDAEIKKKYPDSNYTEDEEKKIKDETLRLKAIAQQEVLDDYDFPYEQVGNLLVLGEPGGGKTSIIQDWAKQNHIGLVTVTGGDIDENVTKGTPFRMNVPKVGLESGADPDDPKNQVQVCAMLPSEFFGQLDNPNYKFTILFVDEINRAYSEAEGALLTLVQDRTIQDRNWNLGRHKFDKFLFTIAAMNPPSYDPTANRGQGAKKKNGANAEARMLSNAMNTRFAVFYWNSDPEETKKFLDKTFDNMIKEDADWIQEIESDPNAANSYDAEEYGDLEELKSQVELNKKRKLIIDTLLSNGNFRFADEDEIAESSKGDPKNIHVLNARTLTAAAMHCNGTVGLPAVENDYPSNSFMYQFKHRCTQDPKLLKKAEYMLAPLAQQDANKPVDKANSINTNLMNLYNEWKKQFGDDYGL